MLGYVTVGDKRSSEKRAAPFYDAHAAKELGVGRMMDFESFHRLGQMGRRKTRGLALTKPFRWPARHRGQRRHGRAGGERTANRCGRLYEIALANGGTNEGAPGPRGDDGFYAAYFRDPEWNKLNAFCMAA